jgi:S-adenosylmethionine synthetase
MARHVAKAVVANKIGGAKECLVHIAYGIGKVEPEMVTAITDTGEDVGEWARANFSFAPWAIIEHLGLWHPDGWSYEELFPLWATTAGITIPGRRFVSRLGVRFCLI